MQNIPKLSGGGVLGHLERFRNDRPQLMLDIHRECGEIGRIRIATRWLVFTFDPDSVHQLLVTDAKRVHKSPGLRVYAKPLLGEGLLRAEGDAWRRRRKLVAKLFAKGQTGRYAQTMTACAQRVADSWQHDQEIDVGLEMARVTLDIVSQTLFGVAEQQAVEEVADAMARAQASFSAKMGSFPPVPDWVPTAANRQLNAALAVLDARVHAIIRKRRAERLRDRDDVLSRLLEAKDEDGDPLTDTQIRDEVMNLYVAGHETTAATLAWTFHLLGGHCADYTRVLTEAAHLGESPSTEFREALTYTDRCVSESVRLYPAAYFFGRTAQEDISLRGHNIPRGATVYMSPYVMHRRADFWPEPERFDPSRFERTAQDRPKYHYMPFGGGPRVCVGMHFSQLEATLCLASISQLARLRPVRDAQVGLDAQITLSPKNLRMRVERL